MNFTRTASITLFAAGLAVAADPLVGTWKAGELDRWRLSPGTSEIMKSQTLKFEAAGKDEYLQTTYAADGKPVVYPGGITTEHIQIDGKEHELEVNPKDTVKSERIDERHLRTIFKGPKGGFVQDWVFSEDGKTLTITQKGTRPVQGLPFDQIHIWKKQ